MASSVTKSAVLDGNSEETVDTFVWVALGIICGTGLLFYVGQKLQTTLLKMPPRPSRTGAPRTKNWVLFSFMCCYALLIPGLVCILFGYDLRALSGSLELRHASKTMVSFVHLLWENEAYFGAVLVVLYAMVIPAVKLALLVLSEIWRRGTPKKVLLARKCVYVLQYISKWASPDMFAYILLLYLLRSLNHPPLLLTVVEMDIGFTCFAIFCVGSTVAALGLELPPLPEGEQEKAPTCCHIRRPAVLVGIVALLFAAFVPLLALGVSVPSMALHIHTDAMYKPNGPLDPSLRSVVDALDIDSIAQAEVSVWECMGKLARWTSEGEANSFLAFFLFFVCVLATTVLDMLTLLTTSLLMWYRAAHRTEAYGVEALPSSLAKPVFLIRIAKVLKKLSFLDVAIVGIVVVVVSGRAYQVQGIVLNLEQGLALLLAAELCHYVAYYLVVYAAEPTIRGAPESTASEANKLPHLMDGSLPNDGQEKQVQTPSEQAGAVMDIEAGTQATTVASTGATSGKPTPVDSAVPLEHSQGEAGSRSDDVAS